MSKFEPAQSVEAHCREIERCNQRGGRMLSIVDLLDAGTFTMDMAAHCVAAVSSGHSFLVGAGPGGAGKTTVMGALLNFVPPDLKLEAATPQAVLHAGGLRRCWVCHEIGPGNYFAYLWGEPLRVWFRLARSGSLLASNLHADTMADVEYRIVGENSVPGEDLRRIGLIVFLAVRPGLRGYERRLTEVHETDGSADHALLWSSALGHVGPSRVVTSEQARWAEDLLKDMRRRGLRTIQEVRRAFLEAWEHRPLSG